MPDNLWGTFPPDQDIKTPHSLLLEQAQYLTEMSKGLLIGDVNRVTTEERFVATLRIVAPTLNNYRYSVVRASYPITLYPCSVRDFAETTTHMAGDEREFVAILKQILSSAATGNVIRGLLSQIRADSAASEAPIFEEERIEPAHVEDKGLG